MKHYTLGGTTLTASGWAAKAGISKQGMAKRLAQVGADKLTLEEALIGGNHQGRRTDIAEAKQSRLSN